VRNLSPDVVGMDTWPILELEARKLDVLNLDLGGLDVCDALVVSHVSLLG
jgi:hypothetical protein